MNLDEEVEEFDLEMLDNESILKELDEEELIELADAVEEEL